MRWVNKAQTSVSPLPITYRVCYSTIDQSLIKCKHFVILNETLLFLFSGGQLPARTLQSRKVRRPVLQFHFGITVSVEKRMGRHEQKYDGRQVHRQSERGRRSNGRDVCTAAGSHRSHSVTGEAHLQHGYIHKFTVRPLVYLWGGGSLEGLVPHCK